MDNFRDINQNSKTFTFLKYFFSFFFLLLWITVLPSSFLKAQSTPSSTQNSTEADSVELAILPALGYNSDWGVVGGGIFSRYTYKNDLEPFHSYFTVFALASTNGLFASSFFFDKPNVLGSDNRLSFETYLSRFFQNQYYGIGNYNKIDTEPETNPEYYLYESFTSEIELILRKPVIEINSRSRLDAYGVFNVNYRTPLGDNEGRLITQDNPSGIDGARTLSLGTGVIWENRDNEFNPTTGTYAKTGLQAGNKYIGSGYNFLNFEAEFRGYTSFQFGREITFANRFTFNHTSGSLPYWKLAELGGEETMRGYPENRFLDDNVVFLNSELRTWLIEFPTYDVKFGATLFTDIGRTFQNGNALNNIFNDLKYTFGFGFNSSFFNENFILRGDLGFSEEGYGVYFTSGYLF